MYTRWERTASKAAMTSLTDKPSTPGFTLIEVLVATLIVFVAVAAVLRVFVTALTILDEAAAGTQSSWLLQEKLAEAVAQVHDGRTLPASSSGVASMAGRDFRWQMTVAPASLPSGVLAPGSDSIELRVWRASSPRTYSLWTCVKAGDQG